MMTRLALVILLVPTSAVHPNFQPKKEPKNATPAKTFPEAWMNNDNVMKYDIDKNARSVENPAVAKEVTESQKINREETAPIKKTALANVSTKVHPNFQPKKVAKVAPPAKDFPEEWMKSDNVMKYDIDKNARGIENPSVAKDVAESQKINSKDTAPLKSAALLANATSVHPNFRPKKEVKVAPPAKEFPEAWMNNKNVMKYDVDKNARGIENPSVTSDVAASQKINRQDTVPTKKAALATNATKVHPNFLPKKEPKPTPPAKQFPEAWMNNANVMKYDIDKTAGGIENPTVTQDVKDSREINRKDMAPTKKTA